MDPNQTQPPESNSASQPTNVVTPAPAATVPLVAPVAASQKASILIVEDDPLLVKMYTTKFNKEGFEVSTAQDGEEGLTVAASKKIDFMIVDVMMPRLSGIDMLARLRQDPKYQAIPVIVLTNLTQKEEAVKLQGLGVKEYLVKANLTPSEVVAKVKQYLGQPAVQG
jgi:DNA-binding response OmpR family regulator